jgi:cytoskeletal protein CcmA (bactofilin family)
MKFILLVLFLMVSITVQVAGIELRSDDTVNIPEGTTIDDDLAAAGSNISIAGTVNGVVFAAGQSVNITGPVEGFVAAAGSSVMLQGQKGSVAAAGSTVNAPSLAARNAILAGNVIELGSEANIQRDVIAAGNNVTIQGQIGRNVKASGNTVVIDGNVGGDVFASAPNVRVLPGAVIQGDLIYESANEASIADGAQITGEVIRRRPPKPAVPPFVIGLFRAIFGFVMMLVLGLVLIALFPRWTRETTSRIVTAPGWSALWGVIALIVIPILALIIIFTIVGLPIGFILLLAYIIGLILAVVVAAIGLGKLIIPRQSIWLQLLVGLLIIYILGSIPILGYLVRLAVYVFGLGAIVLYLGRSRLQPAASE